MKAKERRKQILNVAQHVFAKENYANATTAKIAAAAGITEPTIYMHFKSKKDLFIAVLKDNYAFIMEILEQIWETPGNLHARYHTAIMEIASLIESVHTDTAGLWVIASTVTDPDISSIIRRFDNELIAFVSQDIRDAARIENISLNCNPELFARIIISMMVYITTLAMAGSKINMDETACVLDLLLDSLLKTPA